MKVENYVSFITKSQMKNVTKTMGLLHNFQLVLPKTTILTFYENLIKSHLDHNDINYDQAVSGRSQFT